MSLSAALASPTTGSILLVQAGVTQIPGDSVGGVQSVAQTVSALNGWEILETTGSAKARIRIWDGTQAGTGSHQLADVEVPQGDTRQGDLASPAPVLNGAIYVEVVSGSVAGEIYWSE